MNKIKLLMMAFFIMHSSIKGVEIARDPLTVSVIVPCHPKHAKYLYGLLKAYAEQTSLPDEIVISLSEANQVGIDIIESLRDAQWPFSVKLLSSEQKLFAGQNRNIACRQATSEIFVCQDADDLPHVQRIEVIKYFFKKFNPDFLLHKFVYNDSEQIKQIRKIDDLNSLEHAYISTYHEAWIVGYMLFGQPAIHRRVFQEIQWPEIPIDEDNAFDNKVILRFKNCMMIHVPLYIYRFELSATPYELYRELF